MKKRILFVDDDPNVLAGLRRMLHPMRTEWQMAFASGGEEALAALADDAFDVVVSDMRMPGMDGAQLLCEVKQRYPRAVRIVLSGHSEKETIFRSVGPAHQYLAKPCDTKQLKDVISRACALRDLLREGSLKNLVSQMSTIPSLPETYTEIVSELQSPEASIKKVGQIISKDMGMTAKVLQLVNSAFFGLRRHVSDPAQAASFLGVDTLKALVLSLQVFSHFDAVEIEGLCLDTLWTHSVMTGALAKRIAAVEDVPEELRDYALLAGLLHDAGKLIIAANLAEPYSEVLTAVDDERLTFAEAERQILANTHAEVGAYLLGLWGLPDPIVEAVAFHHSPGRCMADGFTPLTAVHVADVLDHESNHVPEAAKARLLDAEYLERLGLADRLPAWRGLAADVAQGASAR